MDVDFLSRMVRELVQDYNSLSLPGLGTFEVEDMPASFSDRGYTVNPPYRSLRFSGRQSEDGLLASLYARDNDSVSLSEAKAIIEQFLRGLAETLKESKTVELPGLGRLRATRENVLFFVPDDELDISPDSCGLVPVSLRTHSRVELPSLSFVTDKPAPEQNYTVEAPAAGPADAEAQTEAQPEAPAEAQPDAPVKPRVVKISGSKSGRRRRRRRLPPAARVTVAAFCAVLVLLAAFAAVSRIFPGSTDRLLYSAEELEILDYPEDGIGLPG